MEGQGNRVYINPNFNKAFHQNLVKPPATMYVNPAFSQHMPYRNHPNVTQKPKIFINPNFITQNQNGKHLGPQALSVHSNKSFVAFHEGDQFLTYSTEMTASSSSNNAHSVSDCSTSAMKPEAESRLQPVISNSRYSLVRHEQKKTNKGPPEKPKNTMTVSRYKTIRVNDVKKGLENISPSIMPIAIEKLKKSKEIVTKKYNIYKFVRQNSKTLIPNSQFCKIKDTGKCGTKYKLVRQISSLIKRDCSGFGSPRTIGKLPIKTKKISILSLRSRYKYTKTVERKHKKNNIPCPLYRKYGRCLRKDNGKCDFLHDKKHVSICRKFLKGLCFEETCTLSHDLSSKKMPTCYFYLKGACSKEDCPYLHVKLNENATICPDFLKGYCEKGSECIKRHVNMCPNFATKGVCSRKLCPYPHKNNKAKKNINKPKVAARSNLVATKVTKERILEAQDVEKNPKETKDSRYYKEDMDTSDVCENIKPTRCKIGTLPSFIKL